MATSSAPASLYVLYEERLGFGSFTTTAVFAAYPAGVAVSLFILGHLSDRIGRRPAMMLGLLFLLLSDAIFVCWIAVPGLLLARAITGVAIGIVTSTATAQLSELRRRGGRPPSESLAILANFGGVAAGPVISGLVAVVSADPLRVTYAVVAVAAMAALVAVVRVPETLPAGQSHVRYRVQQIRVSSDRRRAYLAACGGGFVSFSVLALASSLAPSFLAENLDQPSHLLAGGLVCAVVAAAAAGQFAVRSGGPSVHIRVGFAIETTGIALACGGLRWGSALTFAAGMILAGGGSGVLFKGALAAVESMAPQAHRAETFAGLYLACYLGAGAVLVLGLAVDLGGGVLAMELLGAALASALVLSLRAPVFEE